MTIAVDFDGVIHDYTKGWADGTIYGDELKDAFWGLGVLMAKAPVFIFTSRNVHDVANWIEKQTSYTIECSTFNRTWYGKRKKFWNELGFLLVTNWKYPATHYVDDRAYRFENWESTVQDILKSTT